MSITLDKSIYNQIVNQKIENELVISDLYASFSNLTMEEQQDAIEIIYNLNIINDEFNKYIVIYNNSISNDDQSEEYISVYGDTFQSIASKLTGDFNNWKSIMDFNYIKDPYIEPGTVILIPRNL